MLVQLMHLVSCVMYTSCIGCMVDDVLPTVYIHSALSNDVVGAASWNPDPSVKKITGFQCPTTTQIKWLQQTWKYHQTSGFSSRYIIWFWKQDPEGHQNMEEYGRSIDSSKKSSTYLQKYPTKPPTPPNFIEFYSQTVDLRISAIFQGHFGKKKHMPDARPWEWNFGNSIPNPPKGQGHPSTMEDILHHLAFFIKPCKSWDKPPINWCRISSINSMNQWFVFFCSAEKSQTFIATRNLEINQVNQVNPVNQG